MSELRELAQKRSVATVSVVVADYDEAIAWFTGKLRFTVVEDTYQPAQDKRWVVVAPPGTGGTQLLLARATTDDQRACIGNQTGGRVFLFLRTDDFWRDHDYMVAHDVTIVRPPRREEYGMVMVFSDLYGNLWDLVGPGEER